MHELIYDTTQITSPQNGSNPMPGDPAPPLAKTAHAPLLVDGNARISDTLTKNASQLTGHMGGDIALMKNKVLVRRLTPLECGRLQGFPDGYTQIEKIEIKKKGTNRKHASDGDQYSAYGNSMTRNVMHWIGERIAMVEEAQAFIYLL